MYTKPPTAVLRLIYIVLGAAGVWLFVSYLLPWTLPVVMAFAFAALLEPAVRVLIGRRIPRGAAAGFCTIILLGGACALLSLGCVKLTGSLSGLAKRLPEFFQGVAASLDKLDVRLSKYMASAPEGVEDYLESAIASVTESLASLPAYLSGKLLSFVSAAAAKAPTALLFAVTLGIGVYFISASYPSVTEFVKRQIPPAWSRRAGSALSDLKLTLLRWLKAQVILTLITFGELAVALSLLRINNAVGLSLIIALIDALPVFGTGTVLIPWAIVDLFTGKTSIAVGLLVTYAAITLLRNCIQAKLLGDQLGLHPVVTLVAIYAGWRIWGVWGMVLLPIMAITEKQLNDRGVLKLWK